MPKAVFWPRLDMNVPEVFFGTTSLGNLFKAISSAEKAAIVRAWFEQGLEMVAIDTAGKYGAGMALSTLGECLSRLGVRSDQVLISNKLGWRQVPLVGDKPSFEPEAWKDLKHDAIQDIGYDGILRCWEEGNRLLGDFKTNLVSVHDPDDYLDAAENETERQKRFWDIVDAYRALEELRSCGETLGVGVGAKDWRVIQEIDRHCKLDWVMFANSFTLMKHPRELIDFMTDLQGRDVSIINSALFHGGFLLGGEFFDYHAVDANDDAGRQVIQYRESLNEVCQEFSISVFELGLAFGRSHPAIHAIALSSSRADRVAGHVNSFDTQIPLEAWQELKRRGLIDASYPFL